MPAKLYDAAIIGAGPDGLAAAALLGRSGLSVIVIGRALKPGGVAVTEEFHPGFFASPFLDALPPIVPEVFRTLDLARRGAIRLPPQSEPVLASAEAARDQALAHALAQAGRRRPRGLLAHTKRSAPWPMPEFARRSLSETADETLLASTLEGRIADPFMVGSALHLLAPQGQLYLRGGLGALGSALASAARASGAEIVCGLDVAEIHLVRGAVRGLALTDGSAARCRAILSSLDLKRSFQMFRWQELPPPLAAHVLRFRMAGGTARLLMAVKGPTRRFQAPTRLFSSASHFAAADAIWRTGALAGELPMTLRCASAADASLAPAGGAVITATVSGVPCRLAAGAWTHERRARLSARLIQAAETVLPGLSADLLAARLIVPSDIEEMLGASDGDLLGGEIAPDQMLAFRPWSGNSGARTPITGFYLAGPSTPAGVLGTCAAGVVAAKALLADRLGP